MQIVSRNVKSYFLENKKNLFKLPYSESAHSMVSVNYTLILGDHIYPKFSDTITP